MGTDSLVVQSSLFEEGGKIPPSMVHSYVGGANQSPDLGWSEVPSGAQSLAVVCYDPDAPTTVGFTHWILFNLDPSLRFLEAGSGAKGANPAGSVLGFTDFGESRYGGMAPPAEDQPHRYVFSVYALDVPSIDGDKLTTYAKFRFLIRDHVLAEGTLTGRFGIGG